MKPAPKAIIMKRFSFHPWDRFHRKCLYEIFPMDENPSRLHGHGKYNRLHPAVGRVSHAKLYIKPEQKTHLQNIENPLEATKGGEVNGWGLWGWAEILAGANRLRPGLRTGYADDGRTSQGLEHCPSRLLASLFQALPIRGSPSIVVIRS